ncbi:GNAT family N-acetyltransferase [Candidatus Woesearchaeota archaeon]|nr:GNAT family N-acetyltransferase [Candidatus Woesearchaeota archaeon]
MPETYIRPVCLDDVDNLMTWVNDAGIVGNFADFNKVRTREDEQLWLERIVSSKNDYVFAIENECHDYVGQISVHQIYWPSQKGRLALVIGNKQEQGKGHAKRALRLLLPKALNELGLFKLWANYFATNERMRHLLASVGFKIEGYLRKEYVLPGGERRDMELVALCKDEWAQCQLKQM